MRNRIIALVLCIGMLLLGGCASEDATTAPPTVSSGVESQEEPKTMLPENLPGENKEPISESEEPTEVDEPKELEGIIALISERGAYSSAVDFTIVSISPTSGEESPVSSFSMSQLDPQGDFSYRYTLPSSRRQFSAEYDKIAASKIFSSNNEQHAGWIDEEGAFFDVTVALGMESKSDFSDPVRYWGYGFTDDGLFLFYEGAWPNETYYSVPVDNISPSAVQEFSVEDPFLYSDTENSVTDWIDDTHILANREYREHMGSSDQAIYNTVVMVDLETEEYTNLIPGTSRDSWGGVIDPTGETVAFLSAPVYGTGSSALYSVPLNGGEPVLVSEALPNSVDNNGDRLLSEVPNSNAGGTFVTLLEWK